MGHNVEFGMYDAYMAERGIQAEYIVILINSTTKYSNMGIRVTLGNVSNLASERNA